MNWYDNYKTIVLDADGVFLDTASWIKNWVRAIYEGMWIEGNDEIYMSHIWNPHLPRELFPGNLKKQQQARNFYMQWYNEDTVIPDLIPNTQLVLEELQNKDKEIAIFSSKNNFNLERIIKHYNLASFIDIIIWRESVSQNKPHPEWLLKIQKYFNRRAHELLMVWDMDSDRISAERAGVDFLWVHTGGIWYDEWDKIWVSSVSSIEFFLQK